MKSERALWVLSQTTLFYHIWKKIQLSNILDICYCWRLFLISVSVWVGRFGCLGQYFYDSQKFAYVITVGRIMIPKDILEPVTILHHMAKMILLMWLRILTWENYPVLSGRPNTVIKTFVKWKKESGQWYKRRRGPQSQECKEPLEVEGKTMDSPRDSRRNTVLPAP